MVISHFKYVFLKDLIKIDEIYGFNILIEKKGIKISLIKIMGICLLT
jgi:hypothetical protein